MAHFQIVMVDGEALGPMELSRPDWPNGSIIYRGGEPNLRVVDHLPAGDPEAFSILVVEISLATDPRPSRPSVLPLRPTPD